MAVIDKAGSDVEEKDNEAGITLDENSDINAALDESRKDTNPDGGPKDPETPADGGQDEGQAGEEEASGDIEDPKTLIQGLTQKIEELEKRLTQPAPLAAKEGNAPAPITPISEEEWAKYEEERGIPRTAQTWMTQTLVRAVGDMQRMIDQRFAKLDRQETMSNLSKNPEFADANKYSKEVEQYLQKVDPRFHSNEEVLKDAVIWARGINYKKSVQNVRNEKEINKRVAGVARPAAGGFKSGGSKSAPTLTALEKSAADATNTSYAEYAAMKGKGRIIGH